MCKIFAMTSMEKVVLSTKFLQSVKTAVCKTDNDGFGYATVDDAGSIFGERTDTPGKFIPLSGPMPLDPIQTLPIVAPAPSNDSFGARPGPCIGQVKAFIAHGRLSTNTRSLRNTHPFVSDSGDIAMIHNGVVYDTAGITAGQLRTDCDSEILLRLWERSGMDGIEAHAAGYYALAVLDSDARLHIARDARAMLHMAWSDTVQSYLIATTPQIIRTIAHANKWAVGEIEPVLDNIYAVFNGNTLETYRALDPIGYVSTVSSAAASRALGSDIPSYRDDAPLIHKQSAFREYANDDEESEYELEDAYLTDDDGPADAVTYLELATGKRVRS